MPPPNPGQGLVSTLKPILPDIFVMRAERIFYNDCIAQPNDILFLHGLFYCLNLASAVMHGISLNHFALYRVAAELYRFAEMLIF